MKGLGRSLHYYLEAIFLNAAKMLLMVAVISFFMIILEGDNYKEAASKIVPAYLVMFVIILNFVNGINTVSISIPMTVSLGSTRRNSFWGLMVSEHALNAVLFFVIYICFYFLSGEIFTNILVPCGLTVAGCFLIMIAMGNLIGIVTFKYGRVKGMITYLISMLLFIGAVVVFALSGPFEWLNYADGIVTFIKGPYVLILGIAADVFVGCFSYKAIQKSDLQIG